MINPVDRVSVYTFLYEAGYRSVISQIPGIKFVIQNAVNLEP